MRLLVGMRHCAHILVSAEESQFESSSDARNNASTCEAIGLKSVRPQLTWRAPLVTPHHSKTRKASSVMSLTPPSVLNIGDL